MEEDARLLVLTAILLVNKPPLKLDSILGGEPDFLVLHASLSRILVSIGVVFYLMNWRCRHVEQAILSRGE